MPRQMSFRVKPISGSCPACLGDLAFTRILGALTMTCTGCGLLLNYEPADQLPTIATA